MTNFMRNGLSNVRFVVPQIVVVNPTGSVSRITAASKDIDIRHTASTRRRVASTVSISIPRDQCVGSSGGERSRPLRGHVDVERRIIFRYALPDPFDGNLF